MCLRDSCGAVWLPLPLALPAPLPCTRQAYELGSLCEFVDEYAQWARQWRAATVLHRLCRNMRAGLWRFPWTNSTDSAAS